MPTHDEGNMGKDDIEEQLRAAQRLNEELRRLEEEERGPAAYEDAYAAGAARIGGGPKKLLKDSKRTFTSAPKVHQAKKVAPTHYTFNSTRVTEIERENEVLAGKLARVVMRPTGPQSNTEEDPASGMPAHLKVASVAPSSINRKKKNDQIAKENAALLARLHSIRPSKELKATRTAGSGPSRPITSNLSNTLKRTGTKQTAPRYQPEWQD